MGNKRKILIITEHAAMEWGKRFEAMAVKSDNCCIHNLTKEQCKNFEPIKPVEFIPGKVYQSKDKKKLVLCTNGKPVTSFCFCGEEIGNQDGFSNTGWNKDYFHPVEIEVK
jgi:hypothetical protein